MVAAAADSGDGWWRWRGDGGEGGYGGVVRRCGGDEVVATAPGDGRRDDDMPAIVAAEEVMTRWLWWSWWRVAAVGVELMMRCGGGEGDDGVGMKVISDKKKLGSSYEVSLDDSWRTI
uniref:Uncharacterized protein n=1 Tax=Tanacetum cinerariifolium TaxID=118510 RepID=A0A699GW64_TANCI|nr:hypothetical protein [Tanacetum cinerariifolium]